MIQNNWQLIREFYAMVVPQMMDTPANQWAIDPYAWDTGLVRLTPIEQWLWHDIRAVDLVLYPQYPVAGFFVDFANPKAKVAIECDGEAFHQDKAKDAARDKKLREAGWTVYRISGKDCRDGAGADHCEGTKAHEIVKRIASNHKIQRNA